MTFLGNEYQDNHDEDIGNDNSFQGSGFGPSLGYNDNKHSQPIDKFNS